LLANCVELITRFAAVKNILEVGEASTKAAIEIMTPSGASAAGSPGSHYVDSLKAADLLVFIQAGLIQEWNIFLDSIFGEVVLHYLEIGDRSKLPSQRFYLDKLDPNNLPDLRSSISNAAKESFSFHPYDKRIETLCSIFNIQKNSSLDKEMKKHVEIRNIFQHYRGEVRKTDIEKIGRNYFEVLDENKKIKKYYEQDKLELTLPEIEHLNQTIESYSEKFEVLP